ncbi:DNA translocase FtsK [Metallibacterium scheffleri]|uniref:DNA translocase FtsK n=1 Tax=Metallibacterium scheffleri TaxID=993689 RepID=A0A4V3UT06_9GAMM|nr:DNA translocase FtsK [Metallibacterium scheffleri]THD08791.1 cell division protein FtsK [Metallibacterium scheffleri]
MTVAANGKTSGTNGRIALSEGARRLLREAGALLLFPVALYVLVCLLTHNRNDPSWSHSGPQLGVANWGGLIGAYLSDALLWFFGITAYAFPVLLAVLALYVLRERARLPRSPLEPTLRLIGFVGFVASGAALATLRLGTATSLAAGYGGILGRLIGHPLQGGFGLPGATLLLFAVFLVSVTLATSLSWFAVMDRTGRLTLLLGDWLRAHLKRTPEVLAARSQRIEREEVRRVESKRKSEREPVRIEPPPLPMVEKSDRAARENQIPLFVGPAVPGQLPPLSLLDEAKPTLNKGWSQEMLKVLSEQLTAKLRDFRIEASVVAVFPGPVITRFEMEPAAGVRGSQISSLDKDIARGLSVQSVRVVDVIPGKSVIGIEIPNAHREIVYLSEILRSKEYDAQKSPLALALGKDIGGRPAVVDLGKMPHLLVAGTTGSGKSVALNAMVLSLLYKAAPSEVRMIMIDPKMLELSVYQNIPHLLAPVVTDMKEAANALRWCVAEMERRYKLMSALGVRNLAGFNKKVREAQAAGQPLLDPLFKADAGDANSPPPQLQTLYSIVVIIDEFADMMMIVGKKVEELIARLAQKARAAGVHLVLATQRPSVDVITGLIKANIPTRIAFQVSSKIDSRTILDQSGAETLLGHGDMLYLPPGTATPERVHGAFVDDAEVHRVVEWLRAQGRPDFITGVLEEVQTLGDGKVIGESGLPEDAAGEDGSDNALFDKAVDIVVRSRRASISGVQRHLRIGYNRAARLIEMMEQQGIVSPPEHNGNRSVLAPPPREY